MGTGWGLPSGRNPIKSPSSVRLGTLPVGSTMYPSDDGLTRERGTGEKTVEQGTKDGHGSRLRTGKDGPN